MSQDYRRKASHSTDSASIYCFRALKIQHVPLRIGPRRQLVFACQTTKTHFDRRILCPENCIADHFTHHWTVFETMS